MLINVYAPTKNKDDEEKEEFYNTLKEIFDTVVGNIKIVILMQKSERKGYTIK